MSTVGIFAGRGDVLVAMGLAVMVGFWFGWKVRGVCQRLRNRVSPASNHSTPTT